MRRRSALCCLQEMQAELAEQAPRIDRLGDRAKVRWAALGIPRA